MKPASLIRLGGGALLAGPLLVAFVWTGGGHTVDCGTWGLTCVAWAMAVVPFALLVAAVPLSIGAGRLPRGNFASIFWRFVAAAMSMACVLAFVCLWIAWSATFTR